MDEDVAVSEQWPFELIQETVDNLRDDIPTLRNICLVSKSWRSASIPHLFAEINLTKESDFRCWESIRERNPEIVARPLRKVILYIPEDSTSDSGAAIMASVPIISPFPVQTFELAWVSYKAGFVFDDNMHRYMSNLLGIRKLTVIGPTVILQSDLFQLMRGCGSKLEDVSLSEMVKIRAQFANSMEIFNLSRLTTLELSDIPVDWLALALPHLKILSLTSLTATDSAEYPWYWRDFGKMVVLTSPSLMYLHLTSRPTYGLISTVPLPLLQSLVIRLLPNRALGRQLSGLLETLPPLPQIPEVTVLVGFWTLVSLRIDLERINWVMFTETIQRCVQPSKAKKSVLKLRSYEGIGTRVPFAAKEEVEEIARAVIPDFPDNWCIKWWDELRDDLW